MGALLIAPQAAQAIEAHYLADISGAFSFSGVQTTVRPQGPGCTITDISKVTYKGTFDTPLRVHLAVSSKQGKTVSTRSKVLVKQNGRQQTTYDHEGNSSCGADAKSTPYVCKSSSREKLNFRDDTRVVNAPNKADVFRNAPDRLTLGITPRKSCMPGMAFADNFAYRYFFPATTGAQHAAKLLSPNTKKITLSGKRRLLESGPTKVQEGDWHTGWSSKWKMDLVRYNP